MTPAKPARSILSAHSLKYLAAWAIGFGSAVFCTQAWVGKYYYEKGASETLSAQAVRNEEGLYDPNSNDALTAHMLLLAADGNRDAYSMAFMGLKLGQVFDVDNKGKPDHEKATVGYSPEDLVFSSMTTLKDHDLLGFLEESGFMFEPMDNGPKREEFLASLSMMMTEDQMNAYIHTSFSDDQKAQLNACLQKLRSRQEKGDIGYADKGACAPAGSKAFSSELKVDGKGLLMQGILNHPLPKKDASNYE